MKNAEANMKWNYACRMEKSISRCTMNPQTNVKESENFVHNYS